MQTHPQEQQLVSGARQGDRASFEQLYQLYYAPVYALAYGVTRERNAAAGILRDTFSTAWTSLSDLPEAEPFGRWVQRICYVQCDAHLRRAGKAPEPDTEFSPEQISEADPDTFRLPKPYLEEPELQARLDRAVSALPDRQRRALILYYNNGLTVEDAAVVMGARPMQVQAWLSLARRDIVGRLRGEEHVAGRELVWADEAETVPFRKAEQAQVLGGMIAGTAVGLVLEQALTAAAASGAAAGGAAVSTLTGTAAAASTLTKIAIGAAAVVAVAGGAAVIHEVVDPAPEPPAPTPAAEVQVLDTVRVYDSAGGLTFWETYNYDENCYLIESFGESARMEGAEENERFVYSYSYDDAHRARSVSRNQQVWNTWDYNDAGQLTEKTIYSEDGVSYLETEYDTYEYDDAGDRIGLKRHMDTEGGSYDCGYSCVTSRNDSGGVDYRMALTHSDEPMVPKELLESYDADGFLVRESSYLDYQYRYEEEKLLTLCESTCTDTTKNEPVDNFLMILFLDSGNTFYHWVYLGPCEGAGKTYDDDGLLTRIDFPDGSHAELTYKWTSGTASAPEAPEPTDTPESTPEPTDTGWKQAYLQYLEQLAQDPNRKTDYYQYGLAYIDGDDIPELVLIGEFSGAGGQVCTYYGGEVRSVNTACMSIAYQERGNLFEDSYMHSGFASDVVYTIQNGAFVEVAKGMYHNSPDDPSNFDTATYTWNGTDVSEDAYMAELQKAFDPNRAVFVEDRYEYSAFVSMLRSM